MEVNPDKGINIGSNPFYRPSNSTYGSQWQASKGADPVKMGEIPQYPDVVSNSICFKIMKTNKTFIYTCRKPLIYVTVLLTNFSFFYRDNVNLLSKTLFAPSSMRP